MDPLTPCSAAFARRHDTSGVAPATGATLRPSIATMRCPIKPAGPAAVRLRSAVTTTSPSTTRTSMSTVASPFSTMSSSAVALADKRAKCERFNRPSISLMTTRAASVEDAAAAFGRSSSRTPAQSRPPNAGS